MFEQFTARSACGSEDDCEKGVDDVDDRAQRTGQVAGDTSTRSALPQRRSRP
jgi:hypothetical protein